MAADQISLSRSNATLTRRKYRLSKTRSETCPYPGFIVPIPSSRVSRRERCRVTGSSNNHKMHSEPLTSGVSCDTMESIPYDGFIS